MKTDLSHGVEIDITPVRVDTDPPISVWQVELSNVNHNTAWSETWPTKEHLRAFLRGLQAGAAMTSNLSLRRPEIPRAEEL